MTATAPRIVTVRQNILKANDHTAAENRRTFEAAGVRAINLASSPGAGKTALLERTLRDLARGLNMAVAVGVLAAPFGRRGLLVPLAFVAAMVLGGLLGIHGVHLPFVEQGVALSVTVLGLLLAFTARLSLPALAAVVGVMGLFHGHAHGTELPPGLSAAEFFAGFTLSTVGLHAAGYGLGRLGARGVWTRRLVGGGVALAGIGLLLG